MSSPPVFRRGPVPPSTETQAAVLHLLAMQACLMSVKTRTHSITQLQLAAEVQRMRHLLDEIEGK